MLFHKLVCPYYQIYSMKMIETEEEIRNIIKILKHIFSKEELFEKMKVFLIYLRKKYRELFAFNSKHPARTLEIFTLAGRAKERTPLNFEKQGKSISKLFRLFFKP